MVGPVNGKKTRILCRVLSVRGATVPTPSQLLDILEVLGRGILGNGAFLISFQEALPLQAYVR